MGILAAPSHWTPNQGEATNKTKVVIPWSVQPYIPQSMKYTNNRLRKKKKSIARTLL